MTFPRLAPIWIDTRVASCSDKISSTSASAASAGAGSGACLRGSLGVGRGLHEAPDRLLGLPHRQVLGGDPEREGRHRLLVAEGQERPRMARGDLVVGQELLDVQR